MGSSHDTVNRNPHIPPGPLCQWQDRHLSICRKDGHHTPFQRLSSIVRILGYGPVMEAESEAQYYVDKKAYLTSVDYMFDVAIIFAEDVLYASVDYTPKN